MKPKQYKLYSSNSEPEEAFIVQNHAKVLFCLTDYDKYTLSGQNFILGATELILQHRLNIDVKRFETVILNDVKNIKKISKKTFLNALNNSSFLYNILSVISKKIFLLNKIILDNQNITPKNNLQKDCIEYYDLIQKLKIEYNKRRTPWLLEFIQKYETSLTYKKGEAYAKEIVTNNNEPAIIENEKSITYKAGTIICEEGSLCTNMYTLESGTITEYIADQKFSTISKKGSILCESSILAKETSLSTLIAQSDVTVNVINQKELENIAQNNNTLLQELTLSLAEKYYYYFNKFTIVNEKNIEEAFSTDSKHNKHKEAQEQHRIQIELSDLKNKTKELAERHNAEYLI